MPPPGPSRARIAAMTQACADTLGAAIAEHTADWHMMQRVFVDDLEPVPPAGAPAAAGPRGA